jgi:hypothetical protein
MPGGVAGDGGLNARRPYADYLSDLSVARDRFVKPAFVNRLWGLPLYYASTVLIAWSARAS